MNPKGPVRVLVAEDSATTRELIIGILEADPAVRVVAAAKDGRDAVAKTLALKPDVVVMDIHMPVMDGFEATRRIMVKAPTPIVIVTASAGVRDVEVSLHAIRAGALTVLPKPPAPGADGAEAAQQEFVRTVKAMAEVKVVRRYGPAGAFQAPPSLPPSAAGRPAAKVVAVAASTGGPAALQRLLSELPGDFPVPILVVQHIAEGFVPGLAEWLNTSSALAVGVARSGEPLEARTVYLAPDGQHLGLNGRRVIHLSREDPVGGIRPSGTVLFDSVARAFGPAAAAVILTGMGRDGVEGLRAVRRAGGTIIAQDEASSVVFGMPGEAVAEGLTDFVLPLGAIAAQLTKLVAAEE